MDHEAALELFLSVHAVTELAVESDILGKELVCIKFGFTEP
jgi:hypothetical protein